MCERAIAGIYGVQSTADVARSAVSLMCLLNVGSVEWRCVCVSANLSLTAKLKPCALAASVATKAN
jgi:hypothetical protein